MSRQEWPTYSRYSYHNAAMFSSKCETFALQRNCEHCTHSNNTTIVLRLSPGQRFVSGVEEIAHFSTAHTWSSAKLFRWEGSRQHDRTPTKIAFALESFPAAVSHYAERLARLKQVPILRSWCDPAEIRTTTYRKRSERSTHYTTCPKIFSSWLGSFCLGVWFMLEKSIRQTMFGQSKGYPTACRGWQDEIERIHPPPVSSKINCKSFCEVGY